MEEQTKPYEPQPGKEKRQYQNEYYKFQCMEDAQTQVTLWLPYGKQVVVKVKHSFNAKRPEFHCILYAMVQVYQYASQEKAESPYTHKWV